MQVVALESRKEEQGSESDRGDCSFDESYTTCGYSQAKDDDLDWEQVNTNVKPSSDPWMPSVIAGVVFFCSPQMAVFVSVVCMQAMESKATEYTRGLVNHFTYSSTCSQWSPTVRMTSSASFLKCRTAFSCVSATSKRTGSDDVEKIQHLSHGRKPVKRDRASF
ncbi:UNVERIFIED_CONTAM: hypothetical protein FKN15_047088 [Acipenser sinensis]